MIDLNDDRIEGLDFAIAAALPILGKVASVGSTVVSFGKKLFHHKKRKPSPPPRPATPPVIVQKKDNTMLYLALAGAGLFLLTRRKR